MSWIRFVAPAAAQDKLREIYDAAVQRAGRVFQILRVQSLNPAALDASLELYKTLMHGPSPLSRRERELLAVVVSQTNHCHY